MNQVTEKLRIWLLPLAAVCVYLAACASPVYADITERQRTQLKNLASEMKQKTTRERESLWQARRELIGAYGCYKLDDKKTTAAIDRINDSQLNLLNIHLDSQIKLRNTLNSSQFTEFRAMLKKSFGVGGPGLYAGPDLPHNKLPDQQMLDELGLSAQQRTKAKSLVGPSPEMTNALTKMQSDSRKMAGLYDNYKLDTTAAKKLISTIHKSQRDMSMATYQKQKRLRSLLTEPQFQKYRDELSKRMAPHKPGPGPRKHAGPRR